MKTVRTRKDLEKRLFPVLSFLWKWKLSTTAAIGAKFFPQISHHSVYKYLCRLKEKRLIGCRFDGEYENFLWVLTKDGFEKIQGRLPYDLKEEGFGVENLAHDFIAAAAHLGNWLLKVPNGCELFSEQELRRLDDEDYPAWVPRSKYSREEKLYHRPDGYWQIHNGERNLVIALEVERHQQSDLKYATTGKFYAENKSIYRVFWLVPSQSRARILDKKMRKHLKENENYHDFILIDEFFKNGWQTKIFIGPDQNQTIAKILQPQVGKQLGNRWENSPCHLLLDTRKSPMTSHNSIIAPNASL